MTTLSIYQALDIFRDNIDDILTATSQNLTEELKVTIEDQKQLGSSWIADEVRKLTIECRHGDMQRRVATIARYRHNLRVPPRAGCITDADIDRARQVPIQKLYAGTLRKHGKEMWGLCPFHDDHNASLTIQPKKNLYHCHVCKEGGDAIRYYMKTHKRTFVDAIRDMQRWG